MKSKWYSFPESTKNRGFYIDKVCVCEEYDTKYHDISPIYVVTEVAKCGHFEYPVDVQSCGKYSSNKLTVCTNCKSMFYNLFVHPYQRLPEESLCWHCLEQGESIKLNSYYARLPKTPPLRELLNPTYVYKDKTERKADLKEINKQVDDLLVLLEG